MASKFIKQKIWPLQLFGSFSNSQFVNTQRKNNRKNTLGRKIQTVYKYDIETGKIKIKQIKHNF